MDIPSLNGILTVVGVVIVVISSAVWLRSNLVKQRHSELEQLSDTRGERIKDLAARLDDYDVKFLKMEGRLEYLEARDTRLIGEETADIIWERLRPFLETK